MSKELGSSKADTLVKVVLVFFISLLSFSVGTFVGKQVSDSDHRRMALEGDFKMDRGVASSEGHGDSAGKISEKEVESLTEEFVNKEKAAAGHDAAETADQGGHGKAASATAAHGAADKNEKSEDGYKSYDRKGAKGETEGHETKKVAKKADVKKTDMKKANDATHEVAEKVAHGEAPSDGMKEERKPSSTLPSVASSAIGKYTVQVASYAEEKEAKTYSAELKAKGWNAFYFPAAVQGRTWYRVSVGLFSNYKTATEYRAQFMKESNSKSAIVQKIVQ